MAGALLRVNASDLPKAEAIIGQLLERGSDLSPLMSRIGQYGESSTIQRFDDETAPDGSKWPQSIRARVEGGKTLTDSARLKMSITHRSDSSSAEWGTNVIYAAVHQSGATIRPVSAKALSFRLPGNLRFVSVKEVVIPARPFIGLSAEDEEEIVALGEDYFAEVFP